jgi:hypothetical protein
MSFRQNITIFNSVKFAIWFGYSNYHQADISVHVHDMVSAYVSTEHVVSMYWNVCLMMVTVTESCSRFYTIEYIVVFWLNDILISTITQGDGSYQNK